MPEVDSEMEKNEISEEEDMEFDDSMNSPMIIDEEFAGLNNDDTFMDEGF
jgi:hypothetical protein